MRITAPILGAVLLVACTTAANPDATGMSAAAEDGKICKRMPVMGSNFPKTVCSTAEEWAAFEAQTRESVDAYDRDRKAGNTQGAFEN